MLRDSAFTYFAWRSGEQHPAPGFELADFPLGSIVAVAELVDCHKVDHAFIKALTHREMAFGFFEPGRFAWQIDNIRLLVPPITAKGQQGLWDWNKDE